MNRAPTGLKDKWIPWWGKADSSELRVFCFPYAGGGAAIFKSWQTDGRSPGIQFLPVELPGRGTRMSEPCISEMRDLIETVRVEMAEVFAEGPYALYGHSVGGLTCMYLARALHEAGQRKPMHVFASGTCPPELSTERPVHTLSDEKLAGVLAELGGTPQSILDNPSLLQILLPKIRADLSVGQGIDGKAPDVTCPVTVFSGTADAIAPPALVDRWRDTCGRPFRHHTLEGGHFFLHEQGGQLREVMASTLASAR